MDLLAKGVKNSRRLRQVVGIPISRDVCELTLPEKLWCVVYRLVRCSLMVDRCLDRIAALGDSHMADAVSQLSLYWMMTPCIEMEIAIHH